MCESEIKLPYDNQNAPVEEPDDPSDLDEFHLPCTDDTRWDVFIPDDDELDPQPVPGDFCPEEESE